MEKKKLKRDSIESINALYGGKEMVLMLLEAEYFHYNELKVQVIQVY